MVVEMELTLRFFRFAENLTLNARAILLGLSLSVCLTNVSFAVDTDTTSSFDEAMKRLCGEVAQYVKSEPDTNGRISIGSFNGPSSSGAGAKIALSLRNHLKGQCEIAEIGGYSINGSFMGEKQNDKFAIVIEAEIKNELGSKVQTLRRKVITALDEGLAFFAPSSLDLSRKGAVTSATTSAVKAEDNAYVSSEKLVSSLVKPETHLDPRKRSIMRLSAESPYGIELSVKQADGSYRPVEVKVVDGVAKVDIGVDEVYSVTLHNDSNRFVGCRLTVDGINSFALSTVPGYQSGNTIMSLGPRGRYRIKGWHHTNEISHEFKVMNYGQTVAAKLGVFEGVGTITATFFEVLSAPQIPEDPGAYARDFGTGVGELTEQYYRPSDVKFGAPLGVATARYIRPQIPHDLPSE